MREHTLKTEKRFFDQTWNFKKPFEIRRNDRGFFVGDCVKLVEVVKSSGELIKTGRFIEAEIEFVTDYNQKKGNVVFSISGIERFEEV